MDPAKREVYAAMILAGIYANHNQSFNVGPSDMKFRANVALEQADALISAAAPKEKGK